MKSLLVRINFPNKSIKFIETIPDETFGDISEYIINTFHLDDTMIVTSSNGESIPDDTKISNISLTNNVLHLTIRCKYDNDFQKIRKNTSYYSQHLNQIPVKPQQPKPPENPPPVAETHYLSSSYSEDFDDFETNLNLKDLQ